MERNSWKVFAVASTAVVAAGGPFGEVGLGIAFAVACVMSVGAILVGLRRHQPTHGVVWKLLALSLSLFLAGGVIAELTIGASGQASTVYPGWQEPFDLAGYVAALVALVVMGRARQVGRDQTITLDALITVLGVGSLSWVLLMSKYLIDDELTAAGKATGVAFSLLTLTLGFAAIRLAIGPGARPPAYYLLAGSAAGGLIAELVVEAELIGLNPLGITGVGSMVASAISFILIGAAALHPSMTELTEAPIDPTPAVTLRRLVLMGVAVLIPPGLLLVERENLDAFTIQTLVLLWAATFSIVMARIAALALARENVADLDRLVASAEAGFLTASDDDDLVAVAADAINAILPKPLGVAFHRRVDDDWVLAHHTGVGVGRVLDSEPRPSTDHVAECHEPLWQIDVHVEGFGRRGVMSATAATEPSELQRARIIDVIASLVQAVEAAMLRELMSRDKFERRFRVLIENSADIIFVLDKDGTTRFVTPSGTRLLGFEEDEFLGSKLSSVVSCGANEQLEHVLEGASSEVLQVQLCCNDGSCRWFEIRSADMIDEPEVAGIVVTASEISAQVEAKNRLARNEARFRSLVKHASDLVAVLDADSQVTWLSPSVTEVLGLPYGEVAGTQFARLVHGEDLEMLTKLLTSGRARSGVGSEFELRVLHADGEWLTLDCTLTDLRDDPSVEGLVLNAHDITQRKRLEETLRFQVLHDDLTGAPNRTMLRSEIERALGADDDGAVAVVVFDVDDFKTINDGLGHSMGDEVLKVAATRLQDQVRGSDTAARLGGDEFAVLLTGDLTQATAIATCNRILASMQEPIEIDGREIVLGASAGLAFSADVDDADADGLLRSADVAMYAAKSRGKGRLTVFEQSMHQGAFDRLDLKADLAGAAERGELEMHYQPFVDMKTGAVSGFEALMRWHHPTRGMVSPGDFIPLAEETGLIVPMGRWLMAVAFGQLKEWQSLDPSMERLSMSVNLSGRQLEDDDILDDISNAIAWAELDPTTVAIELTESIAVEESPILVEKLNVIRALGVDLHADDFGSGFASYAALHTLPFTGVKIDRSLVNGLDGPAPERAMAQIRSIIDMAQGTGMHVIAEGIESSDQVGVLAALDCDTAQGFFFARPAPAEAAAAPLHAAVKSKLPSFGDALAC